MTFTQVCSLSDITSIICTVPTVSNSHQNYCTPYPTLGSKVTEINIFCPGSAHRGAFLQKVSTLNCVVYSMHVNTRLDENQKFECTSSLKYNAIDQHEYLIQTHTNNLPH